MKRTMVIVVTLVCTGCGERLMPSGFQSLLLGADKASILEELDAAHAKPDPNDIEGLDIYTVAVQDDRFKHVQLLFTYNRLSGVDFAVKDAECGDDLWYGMTRAMNGKLSCKAEDEGGDGVLIANWSTCLAYTKPGAGVKPNKLMLVYVPHDPKGCRMYLMFRADNENWRPRGADVKL